MLSVVSTGHFLDKHAILRHFYHVAVQFKLFLVVTTVLPYSFFSCFVIYPAKNNHKSDCYEEL